MVAAKLLQVKKSPSVAARWLVAVALAVLGSQIVLAQNFQQLPVNAALKKDVNVINNLLMAGRFANAQEQAAFDKYYQDYFLARWTEVKNIANLPAYRKELRNSHLGKKSREGGTQVHDHLNALVLEFMNKLVAGPYHPAVQVNAMLMIGELNSVEMPNPVPLPEALNVLAVAVTNAKLSEAVRAAAMVGIERHVAAGQIRDEETRKALTAALLKVATADLPKDDATPGGEWLVAQAEATLARLGSIGENNSVFLVLIKTLTDNHLSLSTRTIAVGSLGLLNYAGAAGVNPVEAAAQIGQFVIDVCSEELKQAKETNQPLSRRRMKQRFNAALAAIGGDNPARKGILSLASDPGQQAYLIELRKTIEPLNDLLDDKKHEADDLQAPVADLQAKLEAWLKKKPK